MDADPKKIACITIEISLWWQNSVNSCAIGLEFMIVSWPWKLKVQNCSCQDQRKVFVLWTSKNFKNISSACKGQITHFKTSLGEHFIHSEKCLTWERRAEEEAIPVSVGYWINLKNATKLRDDAFLHKGYFLKLTFSFDVLLKPILHFWQGAGSPGNWVLMFSLKVLKTFTVIINIFHKTGKDNDNNRISDDFAVFQFLFG